VVGGELMFGNGSAWVLDVAYTWEHLYLIAPWERSLAFRVCLCTCRYLHQGHKVSILTILILTLNPAELNTHPGMCCVWLKLGVVWRCSRANVYFHWSHCKLPYLSTPGQWPHLPLTTV